jgi:N-acetylglucosamine malate deacetylase 1
MSRILVISPHPDDDAIGCGGTLRDHVVRGDEVRVIVLTSGEKGGHGRPPGEVAPLREREAEVAAAILGLDGVEFWRQPDGALRATRPLVERLRARLAEYRPELVYVTHPGEMHPDHRAAARLVRLSAGAVGPPIVRMYEVWTPLPRMDDVIDISDHIEVKLDAIRAHKSQCDVLRFDESARGLSRYRGEMHSWPGGDYAELFVRMPR